MIWHTADFTTNCPHTCNFLIVSTSCLLEIDREMETLQAIFQWYSTILLRHIRFVFNSSRNQWRIHPCKTFFIHRDTFETRLGSICAHLSCIWDSFDIETNTKFLCRKCVTYVSHKWVKFCHKWISMSHKSNSNVVDTIESQ
jgi:hypothetical protein